MNTVSSTQAQERKPLPLGLNIDGRHVWEHPVFGYSHIIDEEYQKKREAGLKYTDEMSLGPPVS